MTDKITVTSGSGSVFEIDPKTIIDVHYSLNRQRTFIITKETEYIVRENVAQVKRKVKSYLLRLQIEIDF